MSEEGRKLEAVEEIPERQPKESPQEYWERAILEDLKRGLPHEKVAQKYGKQMGDMEEREGIDGLTELYNRRTFDSRIIEEIGVAERFTRQISLLMIDIDYFKQYQDAHGHLEGDKALKEAGGILNASLPRLTDLIFRYGGEEFAVILPGTQLEGAEKVAERIRGNIEKNSGKLAPEPFTVSVGVANIPEIPWKFPRDQALEKLIGGADEALYRAKETRNRVASLSPIELGEPPVSEE